MVTLTLSTTFSLNISPKQIKFIDTTDYAGQGVSDLSFVNGNFQITGPSGFVIHPNSGDYTSFGADIDIEDALQNHVIQLPLDVNGLVEKGVYDIVYTVYNSDTLEYYILNASYDFEYDSPEIKISQTVDCISPLFISKDVTNYIVITTTPTISRTHTLLYPNGSGGQGNPTISTGVTISRGASQFFMGVQTTEITSILLYTFPDGLLVQDQIYGVKNVTVDCINICNIRCCLNTLEQKLENEKCSNPVQYAIDLSTFDLVMSLVALIQLNINCGNSSSVNSMVNWIKQLTNCSDGCGDCTDANAPILGLGTILNNIIVQSGDSVVVVTPVVFGNLTTYTVTLTTGFINFVNSRYNTVVVNGTGTGSVDDSGVISALRTFTINMPSVVSTHQFSQTFRTLADGDVLTIPSVATVEIFGATDKEALVIEVWIFSEGVWVDYTNISGVVIAIGGGGDITVTLGVAPFSDPLAATVVISGKSTYLTDNNYSSETSITATPGGGQPDAFQLVSEYNNIAICATNGDSVKCKPAIKGKRMVIFNNGAMYTNIFPFLGDNFEGSAVNVETTLGSIVVANLFCFVTGTWTIVN